MKKSVHFSSASDRWATPDDLYTALDAEFHFDFDPCPLDGTGDGLAPLFCHWRGKRVFCNPPYGRQVGEWIRRGPEAAIAVFLLPARTDTRWFHDLVLPHASEIRFLKGRLKFGNSQNAAPFPSIVVVFRNSDDSQCRENAIAMTHSRESNVKERAGLKSLYFVCDSCNAKWFCNTELSQCPRCTELVASKEIVTPPWA